MFTIVDNTIVYKVDTVDKATVNAAHEVLVDNGEIRTFLDKILDGCHATKGPELLKNHMTCLCPGGAPSSNI